MIYGRSFFDLLGKTNQRTYDNISKVPTGQGDDYATGCLLYYVYSKNYYKMVAIALCKQQVTGADPKAMQTISFTGNLDRAGDGSVYFIIKEAKETILKFLQEAV